MNNRIEQALPGLKKRGYAVLYCKGRESLISDIMANIFADADLPVMTVGFGHSETLEESGLREYLQQKGARVYHHMPPLSTPEDDQAALQTDVYFLSANALTKDGVMVNIDGTGNRIAASLFGPKQTVFVIGRNKIVDTLEDAMDRAVNHVSVALSRKIPRAAALPCVKEGRCVECLSPGCPCGVTAIYRKNLFGHKTTVILVDADMGI